MWIFLGKCLFVIWVYLNKIIMPPYSKFLTPPLTTVLPLRFTWEKEAKWNWETKFWVSSVMCPKEAKLGEVVVRFLYTTPTSPSKITSWRPSSMAKVTDLRQAKASKSSTNGGSVTFSNKAAITKPSEFRITIPRPAQSKLLKIAPS